MKRSSWHSAAAFRWTAAAGPGCCTPHGLLGRVAASREYISAAVRHQRGPHRSPGCGLCGSWPSSDFINYLFPLLLETRDSCHVTLSTFIIGREMVESLLRSLRQPRRAIDNPYGNDPLVFCHNRQVANV